jgi:ribosomal protein S12 methylthiotransferase accessory factor
MAAMTSPNDVLSSENPFDPLVSPFGVVGDVRRARTSWSTGGISFCMANAGMSVPGRGISARDLLARCLLALGAGLSLDGADHARLVAIAEAVERYAGQELFGEEMISASANELGESAIDVNRIPRCSERERQNWARFRNFDPGSKIRWVRGIDWLTGREVWVPAVMACYMVKEIYQSERFWNPISTGYAAHSDPAEALLRALCEVIERDAIEIVWRQMLSLPWVTPKHYSDSVRWLCAASSRQFIDTFLFDATTDMGVPTAYCVHVAPYDGSARQLVGCATRRTFDEAAEHAILETFQVRDAVRSEEEDPEDSCSSGSIIDGARYMAKQERSPAFDFLLKDAEGRAAEPANGIPQETAAALAWIKSRLSSKGMQAVVVDRTPDELADLGLTALCVIIPELQPMSVTGRGQYHAHPRLYEAPHLMGYRSLSEEELNPWPQPLA